MAKIRTILGSITPDELGFTDAHGHLIMDKDLIVSKNPDFRLDSVEKVSSEVADFMKAGGRAMVEMSPISCGRNPRKMMAIAERTGLHVVACTGIHKGSYYLDSHWRSYYTPEQMAKIFVEELEQGMDNYNYNGPFIDRVAARAGVIKIGTDYHAITADEKKCIEAAAIAHRQTGAPIATHTEQGTMGLEQVKILMEYGVEPEHVVVGHMDRNPDFYRHRQVAETGAYLLYDTPSRVKYFPENYFISLVRQMIDAGYGEQLLWGGDMARRSYFASYGGGPGLAYVPNHFCQRMRHEGFSDEELDCLFVKNPALAFSFKE